MIACLLECLLKVDTRCNVKSWQAVKIRYPLQARGSGRRSVRECQDGRNPSPKLKSMRARHVTTNPHPRPTLPCLQTSAKSAVFCIARLSGWTGLVASWLTTARSDPYRPPSLAPRLYPVQSMQRSQEPGMGMDPRRLLALHSNLMRTDMVSIRLSDSTARDVQKGAAALRHTGKNVSRPLY